MRSEIGHRVALALLACTLAGRAALALPAGKAAGTATVDGTAVAMSFAVSTKVENLFDDAKKDTLVVVTDKALGDLAADDDVGISMRARDGGVLALALRLDGAKLVNVSVYHAGLAGVVKLPGSWFDYKPATGAAGISAGSLTLAKREFDGHSYACAVEFAAAPASAPQQAAAAPAPAAAAPAPTLPPASTSTLDPKSLTPLLVSAMMQKDEAQALKLIKLGADPNGRDDYGTPVLNWAVMMCQPSVVKALVDAKASLTYQRAPGMTIMQEAGACPEAAKILRAAGAK